MFRGARFYGYGTNSMRRYRRVYSVRRVSRPTRTGGFWPGSRSSYRRVTGYRRTPRLGLIKQTYTIPEKKFNDVTNIVANVDETPTFQLLNGLLQGATSDTRIGKKTVVRSLHLKFFIRGPQFATIAGQIYTNTVRCMIVIDTQPNGILATSGDLLENASPGTGIVSPLAKQYTLRWKVLFDRRYTVQSGFVGSGLVIPSISQVYDEVYLKLNHDIEYADTSTGLIGDLRKNAIYFVYFCDNNVTAQQPTMIYYNRIRFNDN